MKKSWSLQNYAIISLCLLLFIAACRDSISKSLYEQFPKLCSEQFLMLEINQETVLYFYDNSNPEFNKKSIFLIDNLKNLTYYLNLNKIPIPIAIDSLKGVVLWNVNEQSGDMIQLCSNDSIMPLNWLKIPDKSITGDIQQILLSHDIPKPAIAYTQMNENARKISLRQVNCVKVLHVEGEWLAVHLHYLPCSKLSKYDNLGINGYVRWKKNDSLLIDLL